MKIVLTGGGTMGHITPLLSFKEELEKKGEHQFFYLGNINRVEKQVADKHDISFFHVRSVGTGGMKKISKQMKFLTENFLGVIDATNIFKAIKPDMIISTGGFVTAPVLAAAQVLQIPYFIHEQNAVLGKVNKLFLMNAKEVYYTFEDTRGGQSKRQGKTFGNPVKNFGLNSVGESTLFLGGSGGADFINDLALEFARTNPDIPVVVQAGEKRKQQTIEKVKQESLQNVEVVGFADMAELMGRAKTIVSRAGSSTVCELIENDKPALVIPFAASADNHQHENANYLTKNRMGKMATEKTPVAEIMQQISLLNEEKEQQAMKNNILRHKKKNVAENIVEDILSKMNEEKKRS